ncbi:MAG: hypothetical protein ACK4P5_08630, partial [Fimbriimonadales bacterium]
MKRRRWTWLMLATLGLVLGVYHSQRVHHGEVNPITALIRGIILSMQRGVYAATATTEQCFTTLTHARAVLREHDQLASENAY